MSGAPPAFTQLIPTRDEAGDLFSGVLNAAKPRPIKWSWTEKAAMGIALFSGAVVIWTVCEVLLGHRDRAAGGYVLLLFILIPAARLRFPVMPDFAKLKLLRFAEVTVGRVVWLGEAPIRGIGSKGLIVYAFLDGIGRGFMGQGVDHTGSLVMGAPVAVFYEASDPAWNVALECSRFGIDVPKGQLTKL